MPPRKFKIDGEEVFVDLNFNAYSDPFRLDFVGRVVPSGEGMGLRIMKGVPKMPDEEGRTAEQDNLVDRVKAIFVAKIKAAEAKKKAAAPPPAAKPSAPKRKIVISDEPELDLDKEAREAVNRELRSVKFHGHTIATGSPLRSLIHILDVRGKKIQAMFRGETLVPIVKDRKTGEFRPITEEEEDWMRNNPGVSLDERMGSEDYAEE
jgi:hypothetical protein